MHGISCIIQQAIRTERVTLENYLILYFSVSNYLCLDLTKKSLSIRHITKINLDY